MPPPRGPPPPASKPVDAAAVPASAKPPSQPQVPAPITVGDPTSVCIECGRAAVDGLYREFSKDNIRLSRCPSCGAVADRLIECELVLVGLDLALNRVSAWRHLLFNRPPHCHVGWRQLLRMATVLVILDIHVKYATYVNTTVSSSASPTAHTDTANYQLTLLLRILLLSVLEHLVFVGAVAGLAARWLARKRRRADQATSIPPPPLTPTTTAQKLVQALLYPSFGRLLVVFVMVWESSVAVANLISLLVLSAQWQAVHTVVAAALALNALESGEEKEEGAGGGKMGAVALPFVIGIALKGVVRLAAHRLDPACTNLYLL